MASNGSGKYYWRPICSSCKGKQYLRQANERRNRLKAEDPVAWALMIRKQQLKRYYGITLDEYKEMIEKQGGGCAICGKLEGLNNMPVDHCHKQGHIRGILCHWCNKGLGQFFDNPETLRKAANYIDSWVK